MLSLKQCGRLLFACVLGAALAVPALAQEVKSDTFSIDLPADWKQPQPVQNMNGSTMAIFQNTKDGSAVTITVVANPMAAKDVAAQTIAGMKAGGINASDPVEKDGVYETTYAQGPGTGVSYFASNGKVFAVTTILGPTINTGKELLKNLKPADPALFPKF